MLNFVIVALGAFFAFNLWLIAVPHLAARQPPERGNIIMLEICAVITSIMAAWYAL
jgi:hypothetical protein